jgi:hypothetical protein
MVVMEILRDRHAHQQIEDLGRGRVFPHPLEKMVRLVPLATRDRHQEVRLGRLETAGIERLDLQQLIRPHRRMIDVLVGQRHVLQYRDKTLLAFEALDRLGDRVEARQRVQRTAVMTGRHIGGAGHRKRRGGQHGLRRYPGTQLVESAIQNLGGRRVLDELDQRLDRGGIFNSSRHRHRRFSFSAVLLFG